MGARRGSGASGIAAAVLLCAGVLALVGRFQPGVGVRDAPGYGMQLVVGPFGVDGLSLLLMLVAAGSAATLRIGTAGAARARPAAGWLLLAALAASAWLAALDVRWAGLLYAGWLLALAAALGGRRPLLLSLLAAGAALGFLVGQSVPMRLPDGREVAHSVDLIALTYQNYFGDARLAGRPVASVVAAGLWLAGLAPLGVVLGRGGLALPWRLIGSVPALVGFVYFSLRLVGGLLPESFVAMGGALAVLSLAGLGGLGLAAWRARTVEETVALSILARLFAVPFALSCLTQTALQAGLLGVVQHALSATAVGLLLLSPGDRRGRRYRLALQAAGLLSLDLPGTLGFLTRVLTTVGAFPMRRGPTVLFLAASLTLSGLVLRRLLSGDREAGRATGDLDGKMLAVCAGLGLAMGVLGLHPRPLFVLCQAFVNDFLSHTTGHVGAALFAGG